VKQSKICSQGIFSSGRKINYDETYTPVAGLEVEDKICTYHDIKLYQMDVKSVFMHETSTKVFVEQPPSVEDVKHPNHVYKIDVVPANKDYFYISRLNKTFPTMDVYLDLD
jgi:hypothetical protein